MKGLKTCARTPSWSPTCRRGVTRGSGWPGISVSRGPSSGG